MYVLVLRRPPMSERANASAYLTSVSTDARNNNQGGRRRTAKLRRQSDDSRIDCDAIGRVGGGNARWGTGFNGPFDAEDTGWLDQKAPTMSAQYFDRSGTDHAVTFGQRRCHSLPPRSIAGLTRPSDSRQTCHDVSVTGKSTQFAPPLRPIVLSQDKHSIQH